MAATKLTPEQKQEVRDKYRSGGVTQSQLAKQYGVTQAAISMILHPEKLKAHAQRKEVSRALRAQEEEQRERQQTHDSQNPASSNPENPPNIAPNNQNKSPNNGQISAPVPDRNRENSHIQSQPTIFDLTNGNPHIRRIIQPVPTRELSQEVFEAILDRVRDGTPLTHACLLEQVSANTFRQHQTKYPDIAHAVAQARATFLESVRKVTWEAAKEGRGNPQVLLKILERTDPDNFGPPVQKVETHQTGQTTVKVEIAPTGPAPVRIARARLLDLARSRALPPGAHGPERDAYGAPGDVIEAEEAVDTEAPDPHEPEESD